jgi:hypothetical protein
LRGEQSLASLNKLFVGSLLAEPGRMPVAELNALGASYPITAQIDKSFAVSIYTHFTTRFFRTTAQHTQTRINIGFMNDSRCY